MPAPTNAELDLDFGSFAPPAIEPYTLTEHDLQRLWLSVAMAARDAHTRDEICALERLAKMLSPSVCREVTVTPYGSR